MLKDILKAAKQKGITYREGFFEYLHIKVPYNEFVEFINKKRFILGIIEAIEQSKKELFSNNKIYSDRKYS